MDGAKRNEPLKALFAGSRAVAALPSHGPVLSGLTATAVQPRTSRHAPVSLLSPLEGGEGRRRKGQIVSRGLTIATRALTHARSLLALAIPVLLPFQATAEEGNPVKGEQVFRACKSCHQVGAEARSGVGPHLDGLFGRQAGVLDGFKYSGAMKKLGQDGLVWNDFTLDQYLEKPRAYVPGTRMSYRGMASEGDRSDVIAYLKALSREAPAADQSEAEASRPELGAAAMHLDGDPEFGEYLASECVTCHQVSGRADGIPSIVGWPREPFIRALFEYKSNIRSHQVMQNMTTNLGNEEIAALAAYFGSLDPQ
ncbi:c-type cytochrome [Roseibium sp.]|uniref:c-type cytochrome n=1 Tax=Roseibium sp. TaxID=1936156 RepID=UPI003262EC3A